MAVSSTTGGLRTGVCLSTDRPQNPYNGQVIYETDTNRTLVWDNSAWVVVADPALVSFSGSAASVTGNLTGNVTGNVTGDVTGDLTGDVAASAVTIGGENVTPYTGRRNLLYNGAMQVAQRGTSSAGVAGLNYYTADRWKTWVNAMGTFTQSVDSSAPDMYGSSLKMLCSTADASPASGDFIVLLQILEGQDLQKLGKGSSSAQQLTLSFWVKTNLNGTYVVEFVDNENSRFVSASYTVNNVDTWEKKTITFPADTSGALSNSNVGSLTLQFFLGAGSGFQSGSLQTSWNGGGGRATGQVNLASAINNYWQITGVQLEVGDKATPFEHRSYGEELALCQRYYQRFSNQTNGPGVFASGQFGGGTATSRCILHFHTQMRVVPISVDFSAASTFWINAHNIANYAVSAISANTFGGNTPFSLEIGATPSSTAQGVGVPCVLVASNQSAYIGVSAEL